LEDFGMAEKVILNWIIKKYGVRMLIGFRWLWIGWSCGVSWGQQWTFRFRKRRGISSTVERLSACQEILCYMSLLSFLWKKLHFDTSFL